MGFDSRHLVLEFLADNRELGIQQMTLVFLGKKSDPFLQQCLNTSIDKVFVYHNKGTRLFWKEYEYDKLSGSIIELLFEANSSLNISKNEIDFNLCEPYYFMDLRKFDFDYLSAIAIEESDELIGYALLYGTREISEEEYPLVSLKRLFRNIVKNENQAKFLEFDKLMNNEYGYLKFENSVYLSESLATYLKIEKQYVNNYNELYNILLKSDFKEVEIKKQDNYEIHFLKINNKNLNSIDEILNQEYDEFTLFYSEYIGKKDYDILTLVDIIKDKLIEVFPKYDYSLYKVNDNTIVILYKLKLLKKDINVLEYKLKEFKLLNIRSVVDVPKKVDLIKIANYIFEQQVKKFDYQEYQLYRQSINANLYSNNIKSIVNSMNNKQLGSFYGNNKLDNVVLNKKMYNCFKISLDDIDDGFIDLLEKYVSEYKLILVCSVKNHESKYYYEILQRLNKKNVYLFVDSSVFMNLKYWDLLNTTKGIFIEEEEISKLDVDKINLIIDLHLKQSKLIFINNDCCDKQIITSNNIYKFL